MEENNKTLKNLGECPNCGDPLSSILTFNRKDNVYLFTLSCPGCKYKTDPHFIGVAGLTISYPGDKIEGGSK